MYCLQSAVIESYRRQQEIRHQVSLLRRLRACLKQRKR
jgi:hypothetical protein